MTLVISLVDHVAVGEAKCKKFGTALWCQEDDQSLVTLVVLYATGKSWLPRMWEKELEICLLSFPVLN